MGGLGFDPSGESNGEEDERDDALIGHNLENLTVVDAKGDEQNDGISALRMSEAATRWDSAGDDGGTASLAAAIPASRGKWGRGFRWIS